MFGLISKYSVLATAPPNIVRNSYGTFIQIISMRKSQAAPHHGARY